MSTDPTAYDAYFIDPDDACLAPMAASLLAAWSEGRYTASSGGLRPAGQTDPRALAALVRQGILALPTPAPLLVAPARRACKAIVAVCGCAAADLAPIGYAGRLIDWRLPDPRTIDPLLFGKTERQLQDLVRALIRDFDRSKRNFSAL